MLSEAERKFLTEGTGKRVNFIKTNYLYVLQHRIIQKVKSAIADFRLILSAVEELSEETDNILYALEQQLLNAIKRYVHKYFLYGT